MITNKFYIRDWHYGPGYPVNLQLTSNSYIKPDLDSLFSVIKIYNIPEFKEKHVSINYTEEYIEDVLPRYLDISSNEINVDIKGKTLFAGSSKNMQGLADVHVSPNEKIYLTCWELYDPSVHGSKLKVEFVIKDCSVEFNDTIQHGVKVHGVIVSNSEYLVLDVGYNN